MSNKKAEQEKPKKTSNSKKIVIEKIDHVAAARRTENITDNFFTSSKPFKKPSGDYYRLDLVVRETKKGLNGNKPILTDKVKVDYRAYIATMAENEGISMAKYIHKLIDQDMERNKKEYKKLAK